ncbi:hypothetical protein BAE44_0004903, partial [Dichanthelium oligosanthes]
VEVVLPNKQIKKGTLWHYNLHYNVALVSVKDFCAPHPIDIEHQRHNRSSQLVSVGCCFQTGTLMAARGIHLNRLGKLDCKLLQYSICTITKTLHYILCKLLDYSWPVAKAFWCPADSVDIVGKPCVRKRGERCPPRLKIIDGKKYWFITLLCAI